MKKKLLSIMVLAIACPAVYAKQPNPSCLNAQGENYTSGTGEKTKPFLICNHEQFAHLVAESTTTSHYYRLGADLDFDGQDYIPLGGFSTPFKGGFDGDGYTLSTITLAIGTGSYLGVFSALENAEVKNLNINGIFLRGFPANNVGGLAGLANNSVIENVHVQGIDMSAGDLSGGLVGEINNTTVHHTSTEGNFINRTGSDGSGGLIGQAKTSDISYSASHVNLVNTDTSIAGGGSAISGLVGNAVSCRIKEVYADGNIDFSQINPLVSIHYIGGLVGVMGNSFLANGYYAGKISTNPESLVTWLGGAVGIGPECITENIFWDTELSGITESYAGTGKTTSQMKRKGLWIKHGFDPHFWIFKTNKYPQLVGIDIFG